MGASEKEQQQHRENFYEGITVIYWVGMETPEIAAVEYLDKLGNPAANFTPNLEQWEIKWLEAWLLWTRSASMKCKGRQYKKILVNFFLAERDELGTKIFEN